MTNQEILTKAIEKAVKNGWVPEEMKKGTIADGARYVVRMKPESRLRAILLSHDFAKAFWKNYGMGTKLVYQFPYEMIQTEKCEAWEYHLQVMVVSEDPIKYLESYL